MSLQDIIDSISKDAAIQIAEVERAGKERIAQANTEGERKLYEKRDQLLSQAKSNIDLKVNHTLIKLKAQADKKILTQKEKLIKRVFAKAHEQLYNLSDDQYISFIKELIIILPEGSGELVSVSGKESLLQKAITNTGKQMTIGSNSVPGSGGFIFRTPTMIIDNRFDSLINWVKDEMRVEIGKILF